MKVIILPDGTVTNDDAPIGTIADGVCRLTVKATPVLKGQINAANGSKLTFETDAPDDDGDEDEATGTAPPAVNDDPEPEQHPRLGTKTPAWAEWKARQHGQ